LAVSEAFSVDVWWAGVARNGRPFFLFTCVFN